jgi:hypothetical protein
VYIMKCFIKKRKRSIIARGKLVNSLQIFSLFVSHNTLRKFKLHQHRHTSFIIFPLPLRLHVPHIDIFELLYSVPIGSCHSCILDLATPHILYQKYCWRARAALIIDFPLYNIQDVSCILKKYLKYIHIFIYMQIMQNYRAYWVLFFLKYSYFKEAS